MATTKKKPDTLEPFEGVDVSGATISVRKAGDGLSTALAVDPIPYHTGDRVYVVLETEVTAITYRDNRTSEGTLLREHVLTTEHAAIVSGTAVAKMLAAAKKEQAEHQARVAEAKAAEKGTIKIPGTGLDEVQSDKTDHKSKS
jgi:hypothetical protein